MLSVEESSLRGSLSGLHQAWVRPIRSSGLAGVPDLSQSNRSVACSVASLDGAPLRVCGNCVVGRCVPASRPSTSKWNFGRVVAFSYPLFALFFDDGLNPEWVALEPNPMDGYLNSLDSQEENPEDEHLQSPISLSSSRGFHTPPPPPRQPPFAWHSRAPPVSPFEHSSRSPYVNVPEPIPAASYAAPTESTSTPVSQSRGVGQQNQYEDIGSPPRSASAQEATKLVHKSSPRLWSVQVSGGRAVCANDVAAPHSLRYVNCSFLCRKTVHCFEPYKHSWILQVRVHQQMSSGRTSRGLCRDGLASNAEKGTSTTLLPQLFRRSGRRWRTQLCAACTGEWDLGGRPFPNYYRVAATTTSRTDFTTCVGSWRKWQHPGSLGPRPAMRRTR